MKNCFGYVRVSTQKQGEGVSLEAQQDAILRFAEANDITITKWFEETQTAAKKGRPVFANMIAALKKGQADGVVMHRIDRSARNFFDWAKIGELSDSGIEVHFATESLDFQSRGGRLTANIQMAVAEDYVRNLKAEIFKGQRGQLERGYYPFSAPIGYQNNGKKQLKTIDPVTGPLIKEAFELYATAEYSFESLRAHMATRGFCQANGKPRSRGCFEAFLGNPFYAGIIRIKKTGETFQGAHEPLISPATFEAVQAVRAGRQHKRFTRHQHLFRGLFTCGSCQRSMIPEIQKGKTYYRCHAPECRGNSVREEPLDKALQTMLERVELPESAIATIERQVSAWVQEDRQASNANSFDMRLSELKERLQKLEDAAIEQIIDTENFQKRKQVLLLEEAKLKEEQDKAEQSALNPARVTKFLERVKNLAVHYQNADRAEKREIAKIASSNRVVQQKNVLVEPAKWLQSTAHAVWVLGCADAGATSRRQPELRKKQFNKLVDLAETAEMEFNPPTSELDIV